jgi:amino acid permease
MGDGAPDGRGLSIPAAAAMVANCAIGAGVLSFPFAVRCCGVAVGVVVICSGAFLLAGSLHILATGSALSGGLTYQSVMRSVLPPRLGAACGEVLEITIYIYLLGVGAAFFNVIADQLLPLLLPAASFLTASCGSAADFEQPACRGTLIALYAAVIELPLCLVRDLSLFRYTSFFAVGAIAYLVAIVVKYSASAPPTDWVWVNTEQPLLIFKAIPLVLYAFNCHLAYIPIFNRLDATIRHVRSMDLVAVGAYALCLGAYLSCGVFGYVAFGSATPGDVLQRLPTTQLNATTSGGVRCVRGTHMHEPECCDEEAWACPWDAALARAAIALTVSSSYPILQFVARECLDDLLVNHSLVSRARSRVRWVVEALAFVVITASVSITEPRLTDILDVISTLFASLQVAVMPALLVWYIYAPMRREAPAFDPLDQTTSPLSAAPPPPPQQQQPPPMPVPVPVTAPVQTQEEASGTPPPTLLASPLTAATTAATAAATSTHTLNSRLLEPSPLNVSVDRLPVTASNRYSYFALKAAALSALRRRGIPRVGRTAAGVIATIYAGVALCSAALYYATIGVQPDANATASARVA